MLFINTNYCYGNLCIVFVVTLMTVVAVVRVFLSDAKAAATVVMLCIVIVITLFIYIISLNVNFVT